MTNIDKSLVALGLLVAALALVVGLTNGSRAHHPAVLVAAKPLAHVFGGSAGAGASAAIAGGLVVAALIVIDVKHRFRCSWRRSTWVDGRSDATPSYKPWRDECKDPKSRPGVVSARW